MLLLRAKYLLYHFAPIWVILQNPVTFMSVSAMKWAHELQNVLEYKSSGRAKNDIYVFASQKGAQV